MPDLTKVDNSLILKTPSGAFVRCDSCGSLFVMDKRGNCSACGAPVPLSFTRSTFVDIEDAQSQLDQMRSLSFDISAAATANPWLGKAWGIDVSRYQAQILPLAEGAIDFAMIKMGGSEYSDGVRLDPLFAQHVQSVYDCGAIPMAYWYVDSSFYPDRQYSWGDLERFTTENHPILRKIIEGLRAGNGWKYVKALFFDVETEGGGDNWTLHYLDDLQSRIVGLQRIGYLPPFEMGIYSRKSFLDTMPAVSNWVFNHPEFIIWAANYVRSFPGTLRPLADHKTLSLPTHNPIWFGDNPARPKEFKRVWQYMGSFDGAANATCPEILGGNGKPSALDLNVWEYTRAELHAALGIQDRLVNPNPPPDPVIPPVTSGSYVLKADFDAFVQRIEGWKIKVENHTHPGEKPVFE